MTTVSVTRYKGENILQLNLTRELFERFDYVTFHVKDTALNTNSEIFTLPVIRDDNHHKVFSALGARELYVTKVVNDDNASEWFIINGYYNMDYWKWARRGEPKLRPSIASKNYRVFIHNHDCYGYIPRNLCNNCKHTYGYNRSKHHERLIGDYGRFEDNKMLLSYEREDELVKAFESKYDPNDLKKQSVYMMFSLNDLHIDDDN